MPSLKDIRSRISSVKNTQQITKAMKMVAASKLRRAQMAIEGARSYSAKLKEISDEMLEGLLKAKASSPEEAELLLPQLHPLLSARKPKFDKNTLVENTLGENTLGLEEPPHTIGLVVVSSDRGLCGAYNASVLRFALRRYKELSAQEGIQVKLFTVGRKARDFFKKRGVEAKDFENFWTGKFDIKKADQITSLLTEEFMKGGLQEVLVIYTQFQSALVQSVQEKKLLPMALSVSELYENKPVLDGKLPTPYIAEPNPAQLFSSLLPVQLRMQVYAVLADSLASEFGARMTAMDNATRNAGEMISNMTLQANRLRQAAITKELMEIIGGAEALKG